MSKSSLILSQFHIILKPYYWLDNYFMGKLQASFWTQYNRVALINTTPTSLTRTYLGVLQCWVIHVTKCFHSQHCLQVMFHLTLFIYLTISNGTVRCIIKLNKVIFLSIFRTFFYYFFTLQVQTFNSVLNYNLMGFVWVWFHKPF